MSRLVPDEVILGLLKAQPAHGYELLTYFRSKAKLGRVWTMSTSQLYAVLKRLEEEGAVVGREEDVFDAPPRIIYSITDLGDLRLKNWLFDPNPPVSIHKIRVLFLSRLYIATLLKLSVDNIITNQISVCKAQQNTLIDAYKSVNSPIEKLALTFVSTQLDSALSWLDQCEEMLTQKAGQT